MKSKAWTLDWPRFHENILIYLEQPVYRVEA